MAGAARPAAQAEIQTETPVPPSNHLRVSMLEEPGIKHDPGEKKGFPNGH
jgi:hypothetical protein